MNIRKELLQELYDIVVNNDLCPEFSNAYGDALDKSNLLLGEDTEDGDKMTTSIVKLALNSFIAGGAAVLDGEEELISGELYTIAYYLGIPFSVITCPKLITMNRRNRKHCQMIKELDKLLCEIYEAKKKGVQDAISYMNYHRADLVNLQLDFQNNGSVSYCRYLGVKQRAEDTVEWIRNSEEKPRERKVSKEHA